MVVPEWAEAKPGYCSNCHEPLSQPVAERCINLKAVLTPQPPRYIAQSPPRTSTTAIPTATATTIATEPQKGVNLLSLLLLLLFIIIVVVAAAVVVVVVVVVAVMVVVAKYQDINSGPHFIKIILIIQLLILLISF